MAEISEENFWKVNNFLKTVKAEERNMIFVALHHVSATILSNATGFGSPAREFAEKISQRYSYPWSFAYIKLIDALEKKNTKEVLRLYRKIVSSKDSEEVQEQFTEHKHGYFNRYGFDLKQENFIDRGEKK